MLFAEIRELPRVMTLARKSTHDFRNRYQWTLKKRPPQQYVLGTGHVNFFVDKIVYLNNRYKALCVEWRNRGYNVSQVSEILIRKFSTTVMTFKHRKSGQERFAETSILNLTN